MARPSGLPSSATQRPSGASEGDLYALRLVASAMTDGNVARSIASE